jgi:hypothetical protein
MPVLIKDIQRNSNEIIRIEVSEFKGKELINIRIWYQAVEGGSGNVVYKPTQKGVALNISEFDQLKDGIEKLGQYIRDRQSGKIPVQPESDKMMIYEESTEKSSEDEEEDDEPKPAKKKKS